jgi:predicted nucleic acid-binding protein
MPQTYVSNQAQQKLLVDATAFIALFDHRDQYHEQAINFRDSFILRYDIQLFTTNYVHAEVMSHLTHLPVEVLRQVDKLIRAPQARDPFKIKQLQVDPATVEKAIRIYLEYIEQDFSITDCTCFILMQENRIPAAFTFDDDYKIYVYRQGRQKMGFWKLPEMLDSYMAAVFV